MQVSFRIPRIQAKERPRATSRGYVYTPLRTRKFETEVALRYRNEVNYRFDGAVAVDMRFWIHRPKTVKRLYPTIVPDIDNLVKAVLDGLNDFAWKDDCQVVKITATKMYTDGTDCVEVDICDYE